MDGPIHKPCGTPSITPVGVGDWYNCIPCETQFSVKMQEMQAQGADKKSDELVSASATGGNVHFYSA